MWVRRAWVGDVRAGEVVDALRCKYPPAEYLMIEEAPQTSQRQGRRIDVLVVSLWQSRGLERHAIEIKVAPSDLRREISDPAKADWWWHRSHRFSLAVPANLEELARELLPETWGLLVVADGKVTERVKAPKSPAADLTWGEVVGLLRATAGTSTQTLANEYARGLNAGRTQALERAANGTRDHALVEEHERLVERVAAFTEASGLNIAAGSSTGWSTDAVREAGATFARLTSAGSVPGKLAEGLLHVAREADGVAERARRGAAALSPDNSA